MSAEPKVAPKRPGPRVARLDSLKNPQPRPPPQAKKKEPLVCPNPDCTSDGFEEEDNKLLCSTCGSVVKDMDMVTDLQYGLSAGGSNVVHGQHVGADQAYVRNGDLFNRNRALTSEEVTNLAGKRYIVQIGAAMNMTAALQDSGMHVFRLASAINFIQGRRLKSVAAVALYIACRTQRDNPNQHMLIDFSDVLQLNVFNLGHVYKGLVEQLQINPNGHLIQPINPEDLILRFSQRLEFGNETMRVANDAVRIVQRMNRDWMTPGRRPAGICGAALILAARMNNFRRTVREVVYVVKVQENTIFKRLDEFKVTESSGLTVEEFRTIDLERYTDPPAFYQTKDGKKKRRKIKHVEFDDDGDDFGPTPAESRAPSAIPSTTTNDQAAKSKRARLDSQSMPPPPLPIDPNLVQEGAVSQSRDLAANADGPSNDESAPTTSTPPAPETMDSGSQADENSPGATQSPKKKRGLPKKPLITPDASQGTTNPDDSSPLLANETAITAALTNPFILDNSALSALASATDIDPPPPKRTQPIPSTEEISDSEFASDPEVSNCLLGAAEVAIKTRIWTHENKDWLRAQQAKLLKQQLAEQNGTARTIKKRTRRRKRMGDISQYADAETIEAGSPIAASTSEAVASMMEVRGFSKKINYEMMQSLYRPSPSAEGSRAGSVAAAGSPSAAAAAVGGDVSRLGEGRDGDEDVEGERGTARGRAEGEGEQKEMESIVGELEEEGVYDSGAGEEDDDVDVDDDDDDPYGGGGMESD